jgi:hypothetical protein
MCLLFLLLLLFPFTYYFLYVRPKLATTYPTNEVRMLDNKIEDIESVDKDLATNGLTLATHLRLSPSMANAASSISGGRLGNNVLSVSLSVSYRPGSGLHGHQVLPLMATC